MSNETNREQARDNQKQETEMLLGLVKEQSWGNNEMLVSKVAQTIPLAETLVRLQQKGLVEVGSTCTKVRLTNAGRQAAPASTVPDPPSVSSNAGYHQHFRSLLDNHRGQLLFDILSDGQTYTTHTLAARLGYHGASAANNPYFFYAFQELKRKNYVEKCARRHQRKTLWQLVDRLFPENRPAATKEVVQVTPANKNRKKRDNDSNETKSLTKTKTIDIVKTEHSI